MNTSTQPEMDVQFQMGMSPPVPRFPGESHKSARMRQQRERKIERIRQQKQNELAKLRKLNAIRGPPEKYVQWFLLPAHRCGTYFFSALMYPGKYLWDRLASLEKMRIVKDPKAPVLDITIMDQKAYARNLALAKKKTKELFEKNNQVRWIFKYFVTLWRMKRMKDANEEDPITLSPIQQPVYIYAFSARRRYIYEAETLAKDIHKKLLHNDGQIPDALFPRNILTNEDLHLGQALSVFQQCKSYGKTYWTMESLKNCGFKLNTFVNHERKQLRLHALTNVFHDPNTQWEYNDIMESFIEGQHMTHGKLCNLSMYRWLLKFVPNAPILQDWKAACNKWYRTDILVDDTFERTLTFDIIEIGTKDLIVSDKILYKIRANFLRIKKKE